MAQEACNLCFPLPIPPSFSVYPQLSAYGEPVSRLLFSLASVLLISITYLASFDAMLVPFPQYVFFCVLQVRIPV